MTTNEFNRIKILSNSIDFVGFKNGKSLHILDCHENEAIFINKIIKKYNFVEFTRLKNGKFLLATG